MPISKGIPEARELVVLLASAFRTFFEVDRNLLILGTRGVSEQTLTFRLGYYLQDLFPDFDVDCEYNRRVDRSKNDISLGIAWMKPDIIVHRRTLPVNLVAIEAKKEYRWDEEWENDHLKLHSLTRPDGDYCYKLGLAWRIAAEPNAGAHRAYWLSDGRVFAETSLENFEAEVIGRLAAARAS